MAIGWLPPSAVRLGSQWLEKGIDLFPADRISRLDFDFLNQLAYREQKTQLHQFVQVWYLLHLRFVAIQEDANYATILDCSPKLNLTPEQVALESNASMEVKSLGVVAEVLRSLEYPVDQQEVHQ